MVKAWRADALGQWPKNLHSVLSLCCDVFETSRARGRVRALDELHGMKDSAAGLDCKQSWCEVPICDRLVLFQPISAE